MQIDALLASGVIPRVSVTLVTSVLHLSSLGQGHDDGARRVGNMLYARQINKFDYSLKQLLELDLVEYINCFEFGRWAASLAAMFCRKPTS
ncbi:hypothetical protein RND71_025370 [Anisodus tanguticus]|uniref:Uncharacterized protein n=1 Tax=Anisodus tanguticus TaxID=243964 RepID=A0AAE1RPV3_9SOLA|nr:hypothetical protein RND71_025370 [Anisodus tanguticus]